jgi:predicted HAD superfamily Cof-like phosphohydrolase
MNTFEMNAEFLTVAKVKFPDDSVSAKDLCTDLIQEEYDEYYAEGIFDKDYESTWNDLKECIDLMYVLSQKLNFAVGPEKAQLLFDAVHKNNLSKFPGGKAIKNEHGKILKPEGFDKLAWMKDFRVIINK